MCRGTAEMIGPYFMANGEEGQGGTRGGGAWGKGVEVRFRRRGGHEGGGHQRGSQGLRG